MKKIFLSFIMLGSSFLAQAQGMPSDTLRPAEQRTSIGGYGQVDLNSSLGDGEAGLAELDVHRLVLLLGHRFSERVSILTEIEFEHVQEVYIEQAYLDYRIKPWLSVRGGLVLIPMGIINLYHESATFHSVERPLPDHSLSPTTWREIGAGISGKSLALGWKYEAYVVNGFLSHNGESGLIGGANGFRSGRQKGAESIMKYPNLAARAEYFGIDGLEAGMSVYTGKTQSALHGLIGPEFASARADSSVVGILMFGLDARYARAGWQFRAQAYHSSQSGTEAYNELTGRDLGKAMAGYYLEASYDLLHTCTRKSGALFPFFRYSALDMHYRTEGMAGNPSYRKQAITAGLSYMPAPGTAFKAGYERIKDGNDQVQQSLQAGIAFTF
ncbi:MAG TPA: hypothetical protein P5550_10660 [Bacteroidales bacterium]|nr:hypothetical protein [Bacteroidales bacterium]